MQRTSGKSIPARVVSAGRTAVLTAAIFGGAATLPTQADPKPDSGVDVLVEREQVWVELNYGQDGKVQACRIVRSNAPFSLEASTIDFIRKHWQCAVLAGKTLVLPIVYDEPAVSSYLNRGTVPPPDPFPANAPEHDMRLRVSFDGDGWVKDASVTETTGDDLADKETAMWVKVHWHRQSYANRVFDIPFVFRPASVPPPQPTSPVLAPASLAPAQAPIPAVPVQ
jgi:hypothetical protein